MLSCCLLLPYSTILLQRISKENSQCDQPPIHELDPQVKPHVAAASVTAAAQRVSNGNAQLALELIGFEQDLSAAMQYVFGNAFVCKVSFGPSPLLETIFQHQPRPLFA